MVSSGVAEHYIVQALVLWSANEVILNPGHKGGDPPASPSACHPVEQAYGIVSTGEVKERDPHSAPRLVQVGVDTV